MAQLLTVRAVAAQLAVSRSSVYKMLEGGVFPQAPIRLPNGSPRWPQEVVDDWVEAHRCDGERRGHWKWQAEKGPLRPREKGPPGLACQHINPASSERGGARVAHRREPAIPAATDSNREPAVPAGRRRSVASRETSWTAGTPSSRPGRKAHSCCLSGGTDGVSPAGP